MSTRIVARVAALSALVTVASTSLAQKPYYGPVFHLTPYAGYMREIWSRCATRPVNDYAATHQRVANTVQRNKNDAV